MKTQKDSQPTMDFFYNKETPNYWKFFFFLLQKVLGKLLFTVVALALIFNIGSIVNPISNIYSNYQSQKSLKKQQDFEAVKIAAKDLNVKVLRDEVKDINAVVDNVYAKASLAREKANSFSGMPSEETLRSYYKSVKKDVKDDLDVVLKVISVLELNTDEGFKEISIKDIQQSIKIIREYRLSNKLQNIDKFLRLKSVAEKLN